MGLKIGDQVRIQPLFGPLTAPTATAVEATAWSMPIAIQKSREFAAVMQIREMTTVTARNAVWAKLCAGTTTFASPTAYATVAGSSFLVCASGATQTQLSYARIAITGTATKAAGDVIIIDGTTFTMSATADSSILIHTTDCSNAMSKLASAIKTCLPYLDATDVSYGVTTGPAYCNVWPKDGNRTFNVTSTSIYPGASADHLGLIVGCRSAMMEFKADNVRQIMSTVSTLAYTHVAVRVNATGTVYVVSGHMVLGGERYKPNICIQTGQLATVSSAYSS